MTWTHIADNGARYKVGLFHGNATGHVLIYCNARIIVIDFNVSTSKTYSFFINDQLFDLDIEENDGKFSYGFKSDLETDTPYNLARRKLARKRVKQVVLLGIVLVLVILLVIYLLFGFNG